jgi:hypothetical protein
MDKASAGPTLFVPANKPTQRQVKDNQANIQSNNQINK